MDYARTPPPVRTWWEFLGPAGVAKILVLAGLLTWLYWAHFYRLFNYWQEPDWSHGFLIPFFSLYIVNTKRKELLTGDHRGSIWGLAVMILSLVIYVVSISVRFGYPQSLSIISMIAGLVLLLRGWRTLFLTLFPIGFLVLSIPPPPYLYRAFTQPLQQGVAAIAAVLLNTFPGADIERAGININFFMDWGHEGGFTVAGACSGMRSLMAFVALGLGMAYFTARPTWQRVAMAVSVVPVALSCNVLRVIVTGSLQMYGHEELASGTAHTVLGFLLFGLGFLMYLGILWILDHLFVLEPEEGSAEDAGGGA
ncbi:MAG: exosortase/archaeosortase family protein [Phycisphaerae bacterium]|nr:exosortase/archaeosortase family protein [Phycisphaerae bacterium]